MNCLPNISIALLLLSLTAGMWLLYKTKKETLGTLFKVAGWFVVVVSLLAMLCCGLRCISQCKSKKECSGVGQCGSSRGAECGSGYCMKSMRFDCTGMTKKECCKGEKEQGDKKMEKDSVVVK